MNRLDAFRDDHVNVFTAIRDKAIALLSQDPAALAQAPGDLYTAYANQLTILCRDADAVGINADRIPPIAFWMAAPNTSSRSMLNRFAIEANGILDALASGQPSV